MANRLATGSVVAIFALGLVACGSDGGSAGSFCENTKDFETKFENLDPTTGGFSELQQALDDLSGDVPSEIEDEFNDVKDAVDALAEVDFTNPEEALAALENFDQAQLEESGNTIEQWIKDNCE